MSYQSRSKFGAESEQLVHAELQQRGWFVHPWGRSDFPPEINQALNSFRDTYYRPCRLRWIPDFLVSKPGDPQSLRAIEVKRYTEVPLISRFALNTYLRLETALWLPVLIVFHDPGSQDKTLTAMPVGEALMSGKNFWGSPNGSSEPYFKVDPDKLLPFDEVFGSKP